MSPERDDYEDEEEEEYEEESPRSIFANPWFRAVLVVLILAVVGVLVAPYAIEYFSGPSKPQVSVVKPPPAPAVKPLAPPAERAPATPAAPPPPAAPKLAERPAPPAPKPAAPPAPAPARKVAEKPAAKPAEKLAEAPAKPAVKAPAAAPSKGDYWVQVGAFADPKNAVRLTAKLSAEKYSVQRATVTRAGAGGSGNEVFVAGAAQRDVYDKVKAKGYRVDAVKGGAVVRPPLPLRDAVALSKELVEAGMDVKIRRVGGGGATVHLVRVGGFADRGEAESAQKELKAKGIPGFVAKGAPR